MNNVFIEELVRKFKNSIVFVLDNEIEIYFSKDISDNEHIKFITSDKNYNVYKLNEEWIKLCNESKFSDKDRFYAIKYLMTFLIELKPTLEYKIQLKDLEENKNSRSSWFIFDDNLSYKFIFDYFKSELLEYSDDGVKKNSTIDTTVKSLNFDISWENQTELSELIYVLFHSKRVLKNGKPIQQKDLTELLNKTFNTSIKEPTDLLKKSIPSYKKSIDGKTFISELNSILEVYKKKTLDKDSK